jgi:hypothetical protein
VWRFSLILQNASTWLSACAQWMKARSSPPLRAGQASRVQMHLLTSTEWLSRIIRRGTSDKRRKCTSVWLVMCLCSDSSSATANTLVM